MIQKRTTKPRQIHRPLAPYEWLCLFLGEIMAMMLAVILFVYLGWNPYVGAMVAAGIYANVATLVVAKREKRLHEQERTL